MSASAALAPAASGQVDSEPFVATLRSRPEIIHIGADGEPHITIRVAIPDVWDVVRVETPPTTTVRAIKTRTLEALYSDYSNADAFVMKLGGSEIRNEDASVTDVGAKNGSTFLLTFRRRRPVR
jgi:hypothetical protein